MKVFTYWLARLGILAVIALFLWFVVKWQDLVSIIAAVILAWLVSYLLLPHMRRDAAEQMDAWMTRSQRGIREADAEEDAEIGELADDKSREPEQRRQNDNDDERPDAVDRQ